VTSDEAAVLSLLGRYAHAMDGDDPGALLDCFEDDGVFTYYAAGAAEPSIRLQGRPAIEQWFGEHRAGTPLGTQTHVTVNPSIIVDGDTAEAASTYISLRGHEGGIAVASTGRYADRLARGGDGRWRLVERVTRGDMPRPA
jgi:ketosteroid isomerase-like protein